MGVLDLEGPEDSALPSHSARKRSNLKKGLIGAGGIAAVAGIGSTLAANINLNNSAPVEFGQGVTQTVACDEDGFTITPVSYYDNSSSSYRLDYVQVSGLNLIPQGADAATYDPSHSGSDYVEGYSLYGTPSDRAAHPGQYYDSVASTWKKTCDGVVLDFKAYTSNPNYSMNTVDGYEQKRADNTSNPVTVSSPLFWYVQDGNGGIVTSNGNAPYLTDIAITFKDSNPNVSQPSSWTDLYSYKDNNGQGSWYSNVASAQVTASGGYNFAVPQFISRTAPSDTNGTWYVANSSFQFFASNGHHAHALYGDSRGVVDYNVDPTAGAISKITVESMNYFPSDYYAEYSGGPGVRPS